MSPEDVAALQSAFWALPDSRRRHVAQRAGLGEYVKRYTISVVDLFAACDRQPARYEVLAAEIRRLTGQ